MLTISVAFILDTSAGMKKVVLKKCANVPLVKGNETFWE